MKNIYRHLSTPPPSPTRFLVLSFLLCMPQEAWTVFLFQCLLNAKVLKLSVKYNDLTPYQCHICGVCVCVCVDVCVCVHFQCRHNHCFRTLQRQAAWSMPATVTFPSLCEDLWQVHCRTQGPSAAHKSEFLKENVVALLPLPHHSHECRYNTRLFQILSVKAKLPGPRSFVYRKVLQSSTNSPMAPVMPLLSFLCRRLPIKMCNLNF